MKIAVNGRPFILIKAKETDITAMKKVINIQSHGCKKKIKRNLELRRRQYKKLAQSKRADNFILSFYELRNLEIHCFIFNLNCF